MSETENQKAHIKEIDSDIMKIIIGKLNLISIKLKFYLSKMIMLYFRMGIYEGCEHKFRQCRTFVSCC